MLDIYAHRTGRGIAPENTLEGCRASLALPIDYIDFDICVTQDRVLVVSHDPLLNLDTTRDATGRFIEEEIPLTSLTFEALQTYNVGQIRPDSTYATYFPDQRPLADAKIPSLKEALELVKQHPIGIQIEIKGKEPHAAALLHELLTEMDLIDRTEVQAMEVAHLKRLQALDPRIKTSYVTMHPEHVFTPAEIKEMGGACWSIFQGDVTYDCVEEAHRHGLRVLAWGYPEVEGSEFDPEVMRHLIACGVDGIITDRPDKLLALIKPFS